MIYTVSSSKPLNEIDQSLREAAQSHKFGILNVLDIQQTLSKKGIEIGRECRIYDVCNPQAASEALANNMATSTVFRPFHKALEIKKTISTLSPPRRILR